MIGRIGLSAAKSLRRRKSEDFKWQDQWF